MPMNALVATSEHRSPESRDGEAVSPELVLVDPVLRTTATQRLPDVVELLDRAESTPAPRAAASDEIRTALANAALEAEPRLSSVETRSPSWRVAAGVAAVVVIGLLLLDVHVQVGRTPASAESSAVSKPPGMQVGTEQGAHGTQTAKPVPRRFAWAPADNASGYQVEFFRGPLRVFTSNTTKPQITVPARWNSGTQQRSLVPGEYRWYVWPVVSGQRGSRAIVQAKLTVSGT